MENTLLGIVIIIYGLKTVWSHSNTYYNWPLCPGTSYAEVERGYSLGQEGNAVTKATGHPDLDYDSIQFLGNSQSYVDLKVESKDQIDFNDFSFTMFISPSSYEGTIFHYKQDTSLVAVNLFKEIKFFMNGTNTVLEMFGPNDESYAQFVLSSLAGINQVWIPISISYDCSNGKTKITTYITTVEEIVVPSNIKIGQPGTIRVGGDIDNMMQPFNGRITCFHLYNKKFNENDFDNALQKCLTSYWKITPAPLPTTDSSQTDQNRKGYFYFIAKDVEPNLSTISSMTTSSKIQCGELCLKTDSCFSFTINKALTICKLFGVFQSTDHYGSFGTYYYVKV